MQILEWLEINNLEYDLIDDVIVIDIINLSESLLKELDEITK